ncbi:AAA family ATPase [Rhodopila globiformis]|uniref:ATPase n=1 Tax=Rhodopila globiformis TaxID=1071 RepID=A0A2S6MTQ9_RHOGL|nr:AAA family ATPase [Rhodopila globiformis]PPQ25742.1 ATPase [Rhodopila globiformis]
MALIEGFRVQNYRSLRDVTLGRLLPAGEGDPLSPLTAVIGKNGSGKSTLFDAFGFLADCLTIGVEAACDKEQRGGFERMRSQGVQEPIRFEVCYREAAGARPISYNLAIDIDSTGRPFVESEVFWQPGLAEDGKEYLPLMRLIRGEGVVLPGFNPSGLEARLLTVQLTDTRQLGVATLGALRDHPHIARFRAFLKGWYLSYFTPDAARGLPVAGPQRHLNMRGDNIGNVVQFMERDNKARFQSVLRRIANRIPGIEKIASVVTEDNRVLLRFNDRGFVDPFFAQQMSDGTLKLFAYMLLLEDPEPPPLICIEEPENGLYPKLLETLAQEFRAHATGAENAPQIIVTTHQPYFVDALSPEEVWILEKGADGFSTIRRASDSELVRNMVAEGLPLGGLWFSDYLDPR